MLKRIVWNSQIISCFFSFSGHTDLCPKQVLTDSQIFDSFLGQYGDFCFEFVNVTTQWHNGERHCKVASNGHLVHITNQDEQDYLVRFLSKHHVTVPVWIGLTDSETEGASEGNWTWSSGMTCDVYHLIAFQPNYYYIFKSAMLTGRLCILEYV